MQEQKLLWSQGLLHCDRGGVVLQDAQKAIPKGTLLAILITGITYLGVALCVCKYHLETRVVVRELPSHTCAAQRTASLADALICSSISLVSCHRRP